ncbi:MULTISPECIES: GIDE domain-containing protein [Methylococcus]|uniref:E3 ubiquitin ligase family protein n=1 Tax=Methylococcus capsulatus TaxID=414 RepID=A0ABZ2F8Q6_METCP|nr:MULTISPECIES: GIDE domain-containing protein [Methylococcus]MDF9392420.1 hypothetical protein [Methylococcus capsulatus]
MSDWLAAAEDREIWRLTWLSAAAAALCLWQGFRHLGHGRAITDRPTSRIRSAAQGYVELEGRARMMAGAPIVAPLSGKRCVWYRYTLERKDRGSGDSGWQTIDAGTSTAIFEIEDETGRCVVDPEDAEVLPSLRLSWRGPYLQPGGLPRGRRSLWDVLLPAGPYRYTESRIPEGEWLFVSGQFAGIGGGDCSPEEETRDLLAAWKRDKATLLRRFDANKDGDIDLEEWETAREAARREVLQRRGTAAHPIELNVLRKPRDGSRFLISALSQGHLARRHLWLGLAWLTGFLVAVSLGGAVSARLWAG